MLSFIYSLTCCPQFAIIQKDAFSKHSEVAFIFCDTYGQEFAVVHLVVLFHITCVRVMVIILGRCMSSLESSKFPSNLHLRQESFPLMGLVSWRHYC